MKIKLCIGLKKVVIFFGILVFLLSGMAYAYKMEGCGADCRACHKLKKEEAEKVLAKFNLNVIGVGDGPIKGLWQVEVQQGDNKFPIYIHYSKKYVVSGDIIDAETRKKVDVAATTSNGDTEDIDVGKIDLEKAPVIGSRTAEKKVIVFTDPDCPYCRKLHQEMKKVVSLRKDIAFYVKFFPLPMHPAAYGKSRAVICGKTSKLLDDAFDGRSVSSPKCDTTEIEDNIHLARKMGINSTPTLVLKNNKTIPGFRDADSLIKLIDSAGH